MSAHHWLQTLRTHSPIQRRLDANRHESRDLTELIDSTSRFMASNVGMKLVPLKSLRLHPEANRVPPMSVEQEAEFRADISERGVRVPIEIIPKGIIVDGRSRYLAAKRLGIKRVPVIRAPLNGDDPVIYMLRAATKRRHLTDDQRACLAREEMEILSRIATRERARQGGLTGGRGRPKSTDSLPIASAQKQSNANSSRGTVAVAYRVSERRVRAAQQLKQLAPKLYEQVKAGEQRLTVAKREADRELKRQEQRRLAKAIRPHQNETNWDIRCGDCIEELAKLKPGSARLAFADPLCGRPHNGSSVAHSVMWRPLRFRVFSGFVAGMDAT